MSQNLSDLPLTVAETLLKEKIKSKHSPCLQNLLFLPYFLPSSLNSLNDATDFWLLYGFLTLPFLFLTGFIVLVHCDLNNWVFTFHCAVGIIIESPQSAHMRNYPDVQTLSEEIFQDWGNLLSILPRFLPLYQVVGRCWNKIKTN